MGKLKIFALFTLLCFVLPALSQKQPYELIGDFNATSSAVQKINIGLKIVAAYIYKDAVDSAQ
jgi:hypothetical protein